ncbi:MAG: aldehyde dehydrogenase family protein [Bryobacterales bacterium]|nr:aldehyde dehydrogenase family protein [Bryobacterales bacterium]
MLEDRDLRSVQEVRTKVEAAYKAFQAFEGFGQEQVDAIVAAMAQAARADSERLARMAVEETGYGNVRDKIAKNLLNSDLLYQKISPLKTIGVLGERPEEGITELAVPVGVVAAVLPTTNPTSTAFFKCLIAVKAGNAIVLSPHPRARKCTCEAAHVLARAAEAAGAPPGLIQCVNEATIAGTNEMMRHKRVGLILSTGGAGIVKAAYSSGKPALGVGAGNVPVLLDESADVESAVASVVDGKSFDFGTVCSSEQTLVAHRSQREKIWAALQASGAHRCSDAQSQMLAKRLFTESFRIHPDCVGQSPHEIARMSGFEVPQTARILAVEIHGVGREHPLSAEKLSPVLSVYFVDSFNEAVDACVAILNFGGRGHTCVIYSKNEDNIREYGRRAPAFRVLVNTSSPQGSTGITTGVQPSMTLGCGAIAGNSTGDNVGPTHLFHVKRIARYVRSPQEAFVSEEAKRYFAAIASGSDFASRPAGPAAPVANGRASVAERVDQYLAKRGGKVTDGSPAADDSPVAAVVDRFLERKQAAVPAAPQPAPRTPVAEPPPPAPRIRPASFVCEADMRKAMHTGAKIYIAKSTIVTPAARDLDNGGEVLVQTEA